MNENYPYLNERDFKETTDYLSCSVEITKDVNLYVRTLKSKGSGFKTQLTGKLIKNTYIGTVKDLEEVNLLIDDLKSILLLVNEVYDNSKLNEVIAHIREDKVNKYNFKNYTISDLTKHEYDILNNVLNELRGGNYE